MCGFEIDHLRKSSENHCLARMHRGFPGCPTRKIGGKNCRVKRKNSNSYRWRRLEHPLQLLVGQPGNPRFKISYPPPNNARASFWGSKEENSHNFLSKTGPPKKYCPSFENVLKLFTLPRRRRGQAARLTVVIYLFILPLYPLYYIYLYKVDNDSARFRTAPTEGKCKVFENSWKKYGPKLSWIY